MFYVTGMYLLIASMIWYMFVSDPKEVGLELKDDHVTVERVTGQNEISQSFDQQ